MEVAFFGTPGQAVPSLDALIASRHEVVVVVTQPDRPRGRGRTVTPSPVKEVALAHGIPVLQPPSPTQDGFAEELRGFGPAAIAVVAYGHLLPIPVLEVAPAMNVHFSLLPAYRGAAPVQRALMDGVDETGVSVFLLEPTMDTGPVVARRSVAVGPEDTAGMVFERLAPIGARLLCAALDGLEDGTLEPQPQDNAAASPARKITRDDALIDWERPAERVADLVRALNPRPGAYTFFRGKRLMVWAVRLAEDGGAAGTVLATDAEPTVACGTGAVALSEVQPEGKRRMAGDEFTRGYRPEVGMRLG